MESSNELDLGHTFNNPSGAMEGSTGIIALALLGCIVSDFFGREVGVRGTESNNLLLLGNAGNHLKQYYASVRFSSGINRKVNHILNNKVYFSTSCINLGDSNGLKSVEVVYSNVDLNKKEIVEENKKKSGVYKWTNLKTGSSYVGSSVDLSKRFRNYFNYSFLEKINMVIHKAILKYGYANFKLEILEYCAPEECIKREQYYIDTLNPEYNVLKVAGSTLGYKHSEETMAKFKNRKLAADHLEKLRAHLTELNRTERQRLAARERILKINEKKGLKVEVTDLRTNETLIYNSLRKTAEALNTDLKSLRYNENKQKERGTIVPFKKYFIITIHRD